MSKIVLISKASKDVVNGEEIEGVSRKKSADAAILRKNKLDQIELHSRFEKKPKKSLLTTIENEQVTDKSSMMQYVGPSMHWSISPSAPAIEVC